MVDIYIWYSSFYLYISMMMGMMMMMGVCRKGERLCSVVPSSVLVMCALSLP